MNNRLILPLVSALVMALAGGQGSAQESSLEALGSPTPVPTTEQVESSPDAQVGGQDDMVFQPVPFHPMPSPLEVGDEDVRNDDLVRDIARYRTREGRLGAMTALETAHLQREKARIQARLELLEQQMLLASGGKSKEVEKQEVEEREAAQAAAPVYVPPAPVVRSIYGHGQNTFAEIYIGATKVIATPGTVLSTGEKVIDITPSGVVVVKGGRRQVLQVAGSAGVNPSPATPVSR